MQQVPALGVLAVAGQFVERWAAPHIGLHTPVGRQQLLRKERFAQDGARAQQLHAGVTGGAGLAQVHALDDLRLGAGGEAGHGVVLVEQGDVVEDVFLALDHALQTVVQDDGHFMGKGGVVADAIGDGARQDVAVAVFVLQAFAVERSAARGAAQQEAARLHVTRCPGQVANALEAEHGVVHIERHHDAVVGAVAGGGGNPAAHAAGFVDAFLQDLPGLVFLVVHDLVFIDRGVLLACGVVDADLAEQPFHAEGARFIDQDGHHARAQGLVAQQLRQKAHVGLGGGDLAALGRGLQDGLEGVECRHREALVRFHTAVWQVAAQRFAARVQVLHFRGVVGWLVEGQLGDLAVGHRH